jgi:sialate O-acetylesterase
MKKRAFVALLAALAYLPGPSARADVKPHPLISDGMVLQRGMKCPVWGTADPGEEITWSLPGQQEGTGGGGARADQDGKWRIDLPPLKAGGPYTLTLKGKNTVTIKDVYVGEVWVASGQSNMEWPLAASATAREDIASSANPKIRLFTVGHRIEEKPVHDIRVTKTDGRWLECNPQTSGRFSAVAYYFGRDLQKALNVPVGLIHSSWGGTVAEAWTPREALEANPALANLIDPPGAAEEKYKKALAAWEATMVKHKEAVARAKAEGKKPPQQPFIFKPADPPHNPNRASVLYNGMIHPLQPYAIKGAIWYQGESNAGRAYEYRTLFPVMIESWRKTWREPDFPFLFVQLAPWLAINKEPMESAWAELREAQLLTSMKLKNAGMAVITDVGDEKDIHPRKKEPVGARLALAARALAYGEHLTYSGPLYDRMEVEGNKVVLSFKHVGKGLEAHGGSQLKGFTIAGTDRKFHNAQAEVKGDKVVVWSDQVEKPVAVRYGWANYPVVNLANKEGLLASPFRTDDFLMTTAPKKSR